MTGIGAGKYKLTAHYLFFEKGTLRTDSQQVPIAAVLDVDVKQSMAQKARGVGNVVVHIQRPTRVEIVTMEDIPNFREGQRVINDAAHSAPHLIQRNQNTMRYEGAMPPRSPERLWLRDPSRRSLYLQRQTPWISSENSANFATRAS